MKTTCADCKYFEVTYRNGGGEAVAGLCRRHAPVAGPSVTVVWPRVYAIDWCGDGARPEQIPKLNTDL